MTPFDATQAASRVMARCQQLAEISETPGQLTRVYLSAEHLQANALVAGWMQQAGMRTWQDAVGNIFGRYEAARPGAQALLLGSHLDTVRDAGRYDGMLGVLAAIEVVDALHRANVRGSQAIEIVGFADEEGTRFNIALLGSRGITGRWPQAWLSCEDAQGISVAQALEQANLDAANIQAAQRPSEDFCGYLELHIEQGPVLEQAVLALGVVTAINGARRLRCRFTGEAGHAGTVPMRQRRDALAGATEWIQRIEQATLDAGPDVVATVGTLQCEPGAVNVIPGAVSLTLDIRSPQDDTREALLNQLLDEARDIAARRRLDFAHEIFYTIAATPCDNALREALAAAVAAVQGSVLALPSGAGHDAIAVAERWPSAMLFVRCAKGISHHPAESVESDDVALALRAFSLAVKQIVGVAGQQG